LADETFPNGVRTTDGAIVGVATVELGTMPGVGTVGVGTVPAGW
jgi:hypothetical protein